MDYKIVTANTYYDHSDIDDPIKSYINVSPAYSFEAEREISHEMYLKPSGIKRSRGRFDTVYELAQTETTSFKEGSSRFSKLNVRLDPYHDVYEVNYLEHNPISIMAQIGGLLSFLKFIFDLLIAPIMKNLNLVEIINSYNIKRYEKYNQTIIKINKNQGIKQPNKVQEDKVCYIWYL